jgi:hypothetical protein
MENVQEKVDSWLKGLVRGTYHRPLRNMEVEFRGSIMDSEMFFKLTVTPVVAMYVHFKCIFTTTLFSALCELSPLLRYAEERFSLRIVGSSAFIGELEEVNDDVILMLTEHTGISLTRNELYCLQGLQRPFAKMDLVGGVHWEVVGRVSVGTADGCQLCKVAFTPTSSDLLPRSVLLSRDLSVFPNIPKMTQDAIRNVSEFLPSTFCEFEQAEVTLDFTVMLSTDEGFGDVALFYEYTYSGSFKKRQQIYSVDIELNRHSSSPWDSITAVLVQKHEWSVGKQPSEEELDFVEVSSYQDVF